MPAPCFFAPRSLVFALAVLAAVAAPASHAAAPAKAQTAIYSAAEAERQPLLDTLRSLVNIESGSKDFAGVSYIAQVTAEPDFADGLTTPALPSPNTFIAP